MTNSLHVSYIQTIRQKKQEESIKHIASTLAYCIM